MISIHLHVALFNLRNLFHFSKTFLNVRFYVRPVQMHSERYRMDFYHINQSAYGVLFFGKELWNFRSMSLFLYILW